MRPPPTQTVHQIDHGKQKQPVIIQMQRQNHQQGEARLQPKRQPPVSQLAAPVCQIHCDKREQGQRRKGHAPRGNRQHAQPPAKSSHPRPAAPHEAASARKPHPRNAQSARLMSSVPCRSRIRTLICLHRAIGRSIRHAVCPLFPVLSRLSLAAKKAFLCINYSIYPAQGQTTYQEMCKSQQMSPYHPHGFHQSGRTVPCLPYSVTRSPASRPATYGPRAYADPISRRLTLAFPRRRCRKKQFAHILSI